MVRQISYGWENHPAILTIFCFGFPDRNFYDVPYYGYVWIRKVRKWVKEKNKTKFAEKFTLVSKNEDFKVYTFPNFKRIFLENESQFGESSPMSVLLSNVSTFIHNTYRFL